MTNILRDYTHQLVVIAYLLPCDVERLIEEEAHLINTTLLDNMKVYSQLCMHLSTGEGHCFIVIDCTHVTLCNNYSQVDKRQILHSIIMCFNLSVLAGHFFITAIVSLPNRLNCSSRFCTLYVILKFF